MIYGGTGVTINNMMIMGKSNTNLIMRYSKLQRVTALSLLVFFIAFLLISEAFIITNAEHECLGKNCPICNLLHQIQNTIKQIGIAIAIALFTITSLFIFCTILKKLFLNAIVLQKPVDAKVRINI